MNERQKTTLALLNKSHELSVTSLSRHFGVSGATIRQDLDALQEAGLLKRVHGGAVIPSEDDIARRMSINYEQKLFIAERAASYVKDYETVFIEAGSTNAILARILADRSSVNIVTNNVFIAREFKNSALRVVLLGGVFQHDSECVVGSLARFGLQSLNFTKAFIGTDGYTDASGFTCSDMLRAEISGAAVRSAQETFVVTDSSKFGRVALTRICEIGEIDHLITDGLLPDEHRRALGASGLHLDTGGDSGNG